jgi:pyruvate dehydrogenase E2 component (dihydrolipoamide acetyltransferase)
MLFWYVSVGDTVALGQELCEVETTKSVFLVTAPVPGRIVEICVPEGGAVGSCQVLARLLAAG